jgi:hypothetical protein
MKKVMVCAVVLTLLLVGSQGYAQLDSTRKKNDIGLNISPAISVLSSNYSVSSPFLELRYARHLKGRWYWRNSVEFSFYNNTYFFGSDYISSIKTIGDTILEMETRYSDSRGGAFSTGVEYRFLSKKRVDLMLAMDAYYRYQESSTNSHTRRYEKENGEYVPIEEPTTVYDPGSGPFRSELTSVSNEFGLRPAFAAVYYLSPRFSVRADISLRMGLSDAWYKDFDTGIKTTSSNFNFDMDPPLGRVFVQFSF